eukprot:COSAG04_NODE_5579_length_1562_cov_1.522215_3_plen_67_part_01
MLNLISDLNTILTVTTMFYLQCYAITNLACFALRLAATPNFRPTFRCPPTPPLSVPTSRCPPPPLSS